MRINQASWGFSDSNIKLRISCSNPQNIQGASPKKDNNPVERVFCPDFILHHSFLSFFLLFSVTFFCSLCLNGPFFHGYFSLQEH